MTSVKLIIELVGRDIKVACSTPDAAMILVLLEKAKIKVLNGIQLEEKSSILIPTNGVN